MSIERARSDRRDRDRAGIWAAPHPVPVDEELEQRSADRAREMRPPLAPVHARPTEGALATLLGMTEGVAGKIDAKALEKADALGGHHGTVRGQVEIPRAGKERGKLHRDHTGEMVVA